MRSFRCRSGLDGALAQSVIIESQTHPHEDWLLPEGRAVGHELTTVDVEEL